MSALAAVKVSETVPPLEIGDPFLDTPKEAKSVATVIDITPPFSSFHYQVKNVSHGIVVEAILTTVQPWRLPYYEQPVHKEFRTFIYSFTWVSFSIFRASSIVSKRGQEDPVEDMKHLQLTKEDSILVITSAGDNALHYAIAAQPKRVSCWLSWALQSEVLYSY
jgi:betaine lipid synthase